MISRKCESDSPFVHDNIDAYFGLNGLLFAGIAHAEEQTQEPITITDLHGIVAIWRVHTVLHITFHIYFLYSSLN